MKIQALLGINGYNLMVCQSTRNLYHFSILDRSIVVHNFDGVYPNLEAAIARGKSVIQNLGYKQKTNN